jgi:HSP20 family molecular chaperone IbpA
MPWSGTRSLFRKDNEDVPFLAMQDRLSRMFDELVSDFGLEPWDEYPERPHTYLPRIDVVEEKDALTVTADLPGMDEKDIRVTVTPDGLTIHADRTSEKEELAKCQVEGSAILNPVAVEKILKKATEDPKKFLEETGSPHLVALARDKDKKEKP